MNDLLLSSGERWSRVAGIARTFAGSEPLVDRRDGSAASEMLARTPAAEGADNLSKISRIVVVMEENRSFDQTLGRLSFTVPVHDFLAEHFTVCDRWHRTVTGSNWPNRTIFSAGTAAEVEKAGHRWGVYRTAGPGAELSGLLFHAWFEGLLAEREGRIEDAAGTLLFAHDTVVGMARLVQVWIAPDVVRTLLAAGDLARPADVADQLQSFADQVVRVDSARGTALLCRALVANAAQDPRGKELMSEAAQCLRGARRLPGLLQALEAGGSKGPDDREAQQLRTQLGIAVVHGSVKGASISPRTSIGGLAPTERRIAQRIANGLANPAIAGELGLSKRTVEYHVSNIYMKLGVTNRVAAAKLISAH